MRSSVISRAFCSLSSASAVFLKGDVLFFLEVENNPVSSGTLCERQWSLDESYQSSFYCYVCYYATRRKSNQRSLKQHQRRNTRIPSTSRFESPLLSILKHPCCFFLRCPFPAFSPIHSPWLLTRDPSEAKPQSLIRPSGSPHLASYFHIRSAETDRV